MTHTPTPEQLAIIEAATTSEENLQISALAGAAKTSTLVLIAESLPQTSILCLAFNKKIATEMQERLPTNCTAMTLNSLGHRVWGQTIGKRLVLNTKKTYELVSAEIERLSSKEEKNHAYESMSEIIRMVDSAKTAGYVPDGHFPNTKPLMGDDEVYNWFDDQPTDTQFDIIRAVTIESISRGLKGEIDFNDQILLPAIFPVSFPIFPLVLVDEAQDLSALNHRVLKKLVKKRIIAVGDECQAIYGFRGAHANSMHLLKETFQMKRLFLSISFRCPIKVVEHARWRAPMMKWPEWAKPGQVIETKKWSTDSVPDEAAIICRNNAPLFRTALRFLKAGRYPQIIGNDVGKSLLKILKKFGPLNTPQASVFASIDSWKEEKLKKTRSPGSIHDQAECLRIFAEQGNDLGDAIAYAEHIFNSQGPIQLMTGHKSKGLEFDHVFILDKHLLRLDDEGQDKNVLYVMQTRAKQTLTYIDTELFES